MPQQIFVWHLFAKWSEVSQHRRQMLWLRKCVLLFSKLLDWKARHSLIVCFDILWIMQTCIVSLAFPDEISVFREVTNTDLLLFVFCCTRPVSLGESNICPGSFLVILISRIKLTNLVKGGKSTVFCFLWLITRVTYFSWMCLTSFWMMGLIPRDESR